MNDRALLQLPTGQRPERLVTVRRKWRELAHEMQNCVVDSSEVQWRDLSRLSLQFGQYMAY